MTDALATVEDVAQWFEEDLTEGMERVAETAILSASDTARDIGSPLWDSTTVPAPVRRIVARAVARFLVNPDGFSQSRAADETLGWIEREGIGEVEFTKAEVERLSRYSVKLGGGVTTVGLTAWRTDLGARRADEYVPHGDGRSPIPFFREEDE